LSCWILSPKGCAGLHKLPRKSCFDEVRTRWPMIECRLPNTEAASCRARDVHVSEALNALVPNC
jgi:hypothetical protein